MVVVCVLIGCLVLLLVDELILVFDCDVVIVFL